MGLFVLIPFSFSPFRLFLCASSSVEIVFNSLWDSAQRRWAGASAADVAAALLLPAARWMSLHACVHVVPWVSLNREKGLLEKEETEGDFALRDYTFDEHCFVRPSLYPLHAYTRTKPSPSRDRHESFRVLKVVKLVS